jgi:hypothetical protein
MVTVSQTVMDILNRQVFLQEAISNNIVSYNKLAINIKEEIEKEIGKKVNHNTIVMALRRYSKKLEGKQHKISLNYFREILLKTDICYIIVEESPTALDKIQSLYHKTELKHGKIFNIVHGIYEVNIITNQVYKQKALDNLVDENVLRVIDDLVVISLLYSRDFLLVPGVLYNVLRFLSWENINILSITPTSQELNILVDRKDAIKCYDILERLARSSKNYSK